MLHNSCNTGTRALPDMSTLALGHRPYISGNALLPVLQLLNDTLPDAIKVLQKQSSWQVLLRLDS